MAIMSRASSGLLLAITSTITFALSGAFVKPLLESGWTPGSAVIARVLIAGVVLSPFAAVALRGRWRTIWTGRRRIIGFGLIPVAATQLAYFAAIARIPIGMALLIEYLAPVLLVLLAWARTRSVPPAVVIVGSVLALGGLVLVIGPGVAGPIDLLGVLFAATAAIGLAAYFLIAAMPDDGVPPVALAASGLLLGGVALLALGLVGIVPLGATFGTVDLLGATVAWWIPLGVVALLATAVAYATGIAATTRLGSRLASFVGLLEVAFAALFAWILLGEALSPLQLLGGVLIIAGIAFVRAERGADAVSPESERVTTSAEPA
ncbi:EamA family transporter [Glaciibacter flavus]|nr:DMT family transporter [Glaciibacter flavus]